MRSAVLMLTVVVAAAAEAPYHLPRPAPHAPPFGYPSGPAPAPPLLPQFPRPVPHLLPAPQQPYTPSQGYNYQRPNIRPALIHPIPQPIPQPIPVSHPPPPVYLPAFQPQPLPIAIPRPLPISYPQPQPLPVSYPQPIPIPQPSYGLPQPLLLPQSQPQPQLSVAPLPAPIFHQSQSNAYQQLIPQPQFAAPLPLQSQPLTNNAVSSYQADSNQYATAQAQTHSEALDQTVVSMLQNIIRDNEHSSAKNAGYLSLVSGVSLESAKPSIEISSFVQNSPLNDAPSIDIRTASNAVQSSPSAVNVVSSYEAPTVSGGSSQSSVSNTNFGFLPINKPGQSYGVPN